MTSSGQVSFDVLNIDYAAEADRIGVRLLPAIEMDAEWPNELHILGLDIDIHEARLTSALAAAMTRRCERNDEIVSRLLRAGYDIRPYLTGEAELRGICLTSRAIR